MENQGWVKLHRKLLNNPIFYDRDLLQLWIYLLLKCNHTDHFWIYNFEKIKIQRGQCVISQKKVSVELKQSASKINRMLKYLKSETQIDTQTDRQFTMVTIINWNHYQESDTPFEIQTKHVRNTNETQTKTNKNVKNVKNENIQVVAKATTSQEENKNKTLSTLTGSVAPSTNGVPIYNGDRSSKMSEYIDRFNKLTGRSFKHLSDRTGKAFLKRLDEGYTLDEILEAVQNAYKAPYHIETEFRYLTPEFFTRTDKLEMYINSKVTESKPKYNIF